MVDSAGGGGESLQLRFHLDLVSNEEEEPATRHSRESVFPEEGTAIAKALW